MRVTLSLRNNYERVEHGHAIPVAVPNEPDTDDLLDRFLVIGTPETVVRQIKRIEECVGISHFNCSFWFGDLDHPRVHEVDGAVCARGDARVQVMAVTARSSDGRSLTAGTGSWRVRDSGGR